MQKSEFKKEQWRHRPRGAAVRPTAKTREMCAPGRYRFRPRRNIFGTHQKTGEHHGGTSQLPVQTVPCTETARKTKRGKRKQTSKGPRKVTTPKLESLLYACLHQPSKARESHHRTRQTRRRRAQGMFPWSIGNVSSLALVMKVSVKDLQRVL